MSPPGGIDEDQMISPADERLGAPQVCPHCLRARRFLDDVAFEAQLRQYEALYVRCCRARAFGKRVCQGLRQAVAARVAVNDEDIHGASSILSSAEAVCTVRKMLATECAFAIRG